MIKNWKLFLEKIINESIIYFNPLVESEIGISQDNIQDIFQDIITDFYQYQIRIKYLDGAANLRDSVYTNKMVYISIEIPNANSKIFRDAFIDFEKMDSEGYFDQIKDKLEEFGIEVIKIEPPNSNPFQGMASYTSLCNITIVGRKKKNI